MVLEREEEMDGEGEEMVKDIDVAKDGETLTGDNSYIPDNKQDLVYFHPESRVAFHVFHFGIQTPSC